MFPSHSQGIPSSLSDDSPPWLSGFLFPLSFFPLLLLAFLLPPSYAAHFSMYLPVIRLSSGRKFLLSPPPSSFLSLLIPLVKSTTLCVMSCPIQTSTFQVLCFTRGCCLSGLISLPRDLDLYRDSLLNIHWGLQEMVLEFCGGVALC